MHMGKTNRVRPIPHHFNSYFYNKLKVNLSCTNYSLVIRFIVVPLRYTNACKDSRYILSIISNSGLDGGE